MRHMALTLLVGVLVLAGLQPASAASKPAGTGLVSFTAASYSRSSGTAGLTVDWEPVSRASSYQVFVSRSYSMSGAKTYKTSHTTKTLKGLRAGDDYFVQVRGVNGSGAGTKSARVGHTTIRQQEIAKGDVYRVMTYNLCTDKCDSTGGAWSTRQAAAKERMTYWNPDVIAAQEANGLTTPPPGYALAVFKSAKRLLYKTDTFFAPVTAARAPAKPADVQGCDATWTNGRTGYVFLGRHGAGCRYAVWAELVSRDTGSHTIFVDVHTVTGDSDSRAEDRKEETTTLLASIASINPDGLPVVYAGDFNSHKNRSNDYLRSVLHRSGYYDAYDLAMELYRQHLNSYNDFSVRPKTSIKWGDHVDHVWIRPSEGRVLRWANGAKLSHGKMVRPIPSDHSPLVVDVRLNQAGPGLPPAP